jgi:hypothetical protein
MHTLKLLRRALIQMVKQAWSLPQAVSMAVKQRRRRSFLVELEDERLDRIRNPSKYLGK